MKFTIIIVLYFFRVHFSFYYPLENKVFSSKKCTFSFSLSRKNYYLCTQTHHYNGRRKQISHQGIILLLAQHMDVGKYHTTRDARLL